MVAKASSWKGECPPSGPFSGHFLRGGWPPCPEDTQATLWREVSSKASTRLPSLWVRDLQANLLPHSDPQRDVSLPGTLISVFLLHGMSALTSMGLYVCIESQVWLSRKKSLPLLSAFKTRLILYVYKVRVMWFIVSMGRLICYFIKWV